MQLLNAYLWPLCGFQIFHICTTCNSIYHWIIEKQFWRHLTNVWRVFLYAWNRWRQSFTDTFSIYSIIFGRWIDIGIGNFALTLSGGISTMNPSSAVTLFTLLQFRYGTLDVLNEQNFTSCRDTETYFIMVRNDPLEMDPLVGWAPWNLSCFEFKFDDTRLSS